MDAEMIEKVARAIAKAIGPVPAIVETDHRVMAVAAIAALAATPQAAQARVSWGDFWMDKGEMEVAGDYAMFEKANTWRTANATPQAAQVPEGYALVPVEPTEAMWEAAQARISKNTIVIDAGPAKGSTLVRDPLAHAWYAMIAAAPKAEHVMSIDCWCKPQRDAEVPSVVVHNDVQPTTPQADPWQPSGVELDLAIHHNIDAAAWADAFVQTFPGQASKRDLMLAWFANAMMAMHDKLTGAAPINGDHAEFMLSRGIEPATPQAAQVPEAWMHDIVQGDGEPDVALSFREDSFPLANELGWQSLRARPLYLAPQPQSAQGPKGIPCWFLMLDGKPVHIYEQSDGETAHDVMTQMFGGKGGARSVEKARELGYTVEPGLAMLAAQQPQAAQVPEGGDELRLAACRLFFAAANIELMAEFRERFPRKHLRLKEAIDSIRPLLSDAAAQAQGVGRG